MHIKKTFDQNGIAMPFIIIGFLIVLSLVGFSAYRIGMSSTDDTGTSDTTTKEQVPPQDNVDREPSKTSTKKYVFKNTGLAMDLPQAWTPTIEEFDQTGDGIMDSYNLTLPADDDWKLLSTVYYGGKGGGPACYFENEKNNPQIREYEKNPCPYFTVKKIVDTRTDNKLALLDTDQDKKCIVYISPDETQRKVGDVYQSTLWECLDKISINKAVANPDAQNIPVSFQISIQIPDKYNKMPIDEFMQTSAFKSTFDAMASLQPTQ
jgi:hypothetical protein